MVEDNSNGTGLIGWLGKNIGSVIIVITLVASVAAQWAVINDRVKDIDKLQDSVAALLSRIDRLEVRYENLRDLVVELRRTGLLRDVPPPLE